MVPPSQETAKLRMKLPAGRDKASKAALRTGKSKSGKSCVWVTRPGELVPTEYGFRIEDEARAWTNFHKMQVHV